MYKAIHIHIPEPCHENWHNMTPKEQGRFCGACQKTVVDFSAMTNKEILDYISNAGQNMCGRFAPNQLNKELTITENKRRFSWAYFWNILLATLLFTEAKAQGKPVIKKKPAVHQMDLLPRVGTIAVEQPNDPLPPKEINGRVLDESSMPVAGATVRIIGTTRGVTADTAGNFRFLIDKGDTVSLEISAIGYKTKTVLIDSKTNWKDVKVLLYMEYLIMGGITFEEKVPKKVKVKKVEKVTRAEKVKRVINDWKPAALKKDIKIYPNPVVRGNAIQVNLSLKQAGEYKLELLDVRGKVMTVQRLVMAAKEQKVTVPTQAAWSSGIYWMRISAPDMKNVYQGKVAIK